MGILFSSAEVFKGPPYIALSQYVGLGSGLQSWSQGKAEVLFLNSRFSSSDIYHSVEETLPSA